MVAGVLRAGCLSGFLLSIAQLTVFIGIKLFQHLFLHVSTHVLALLITELTILIGIKLFQHLSRHSRAVATLTTGAFGAMLTTLTVTGSLTFMLFLHFCLHGFFFSIAELTVLVCIETLQHFLMKILTVCTTGHLAGGPPMAGLLHTGSRCGDFLGHGGFLLCEHRQSTQYSYK